MGQIERGFNRIYGIERDRPSVQKYGRAFLLMVGAGSGLAVAFFVFALGPRQRRTTGSCCGRRGPGSAGRSLSPSRRWLSPRCSTGRRAGGSPPGRGCVFGAAVCVAGWALVTIVLGAALGLSSSFGETYGPLAGIVALQLWTLLSAIAIFFGAAVAAQLEAVRAGRPEPAPETVPEPELRPAAGSTSYAS